MDLTKAQRLLNKIQAFLDNGNGHELSRLEKDLIKSYVQQLYDAVTSEDNPVQEHQKPVESTYQKSQRSEPIHKTEVHTPKVETPAARVTDVPKSEPVKQTFSDFTPPVEKPKQPAYYPTEEKQETPVYSDFTPPVHKTETPAYVEPEVPELKRNEFKTEAESTVSTPSYSESKTPVDDVKEVYPEPRQHATGGDQNEAMQKLFDLQKSDEMSSRFGHVPISSIESAMGLNERIFTLNELFGGDKALFDAWCAKLNSLGSFTEAKNVLMAGPAKDFKWADPQRIKMAEQFIRIVSRRYPKSAN